MALFRAATLLTAATTVAASAGDGNTPRTSLAAGAAQPSPQGVGLLSTPWLRGVAEANHYGASMLASAPWVRSSAVAVGSLGKVASPPTAAGAVDASSSKLEDIASLLLTSPWARSTEMEQKGGVK
ncbi:unnamed protein product, partial [Ectocarpus sp. 8 AP-2014]